MPVSGVPMSAHSPIRKNIAVPVITPVACRVVGSAGKIRAMPGECGGFQMSDFHSWIVTYMAPKGFKTLPVHIAQLSLAAVLKCGQSFRWIAYPLAIPEEVKVEQDTVVPTHEYRFALQDRVICLRQDSDSLFYRAVFPKDVGDAYKDSEIAKKKDKETLDWLRDYFQLDIDLVSLYTEWAERDVVFRETVKDRFAGIRMLRQDPWENVIS